VGRTLLSDAFDFDLDLAEDKQDAWSTVEERRFSAAIKARRLIRLQPLRHMRVPNLRSFRRGQHDATGANARRLPSTIGQSSVRRIDEICMTYFSPFPTKMVRPYNVAPLLLNGPPS
jgi:hypothetical protein